jgi:hypothetical protein
MGDPYVYSSDNKALVYQDEKGNLINPSDAENIFIVKIDGSERTQYID